MKNFLLFLLLSLFSLVSKAQNLVPNPGFETSLYMTTYATMTCVAQWKPYSGPFNAVMNSPDLKDPNSWMASSQAYEGTHYVAMDCERQNPEYIQVRMTAPMKAGKTYCVSFYMSRLNLTVASSLGAYFSVNALTVNPQTAGLAAHVQSSVPAVPGVWQRVTGTYIATGGEEFVTFGGFQNQSALFFSYMYIDMIEVYEIDPFLDLGNDRTICPGNSTFLSAGTGGAHYLWNTGETASSVSVSQPGKYWVEKFYGACSVSDTVEIFNGGLTLNLGDDRTLCNGDHTVLNAGTNGSAYHWSTGEQTAFIGISTPGKYWVEKIQGTCSVSDTIIITLSDCLPSPPIPVVEGTLFVPNSFTPNNDGLNDRFEIKAYNISEYKMIIYNRWGEAIF
ncbi:MAG: gliding motility-associated C-terminal domain-containing protein, partial [Bacteroidota bacterium]